LEYSKLRRGEQQPNMEIVSLTLSLFSSQRLVNADFDSFESAIAFLQREEVSGEATISRKRSIVFYSIDAD